MTGITQSVVVHNNHNSKKQPGPNSSLDYCKVTQHHFVPRSNGSSGSRQNRTQKTQNEKK